MDTTYAVGIVEKVTEQETVKTSCEQQYSWNIVEIPKAF